MIPARRSRFAGRHQAQALETAELLAQLLGGNDMASSRAVYVKVPDGSRPETDSEMMSSDINLICVS
jgi:hypothetical protein